MTLLFLQLGFITTTQSLPLESPAATAQQQERTTDGWRESFTRKMTERQKAHARLFDVYRNVIGPAKMLEPGQSTSIDLMPFLTHDLKTVGQLLEEWKCLSDAVFTASVSSHASFPTESWTFLITEYEIAIEQAFWSPPNREFAPQTLTTLVRPGGEIVIDGKEISATENLFPPLQTGSSYFMCSRN